jgi:CIC family chloride channel protein
MAYDLSAVLRRLAPPTPLDLRLLGRTLLHAAFVGGFAGAIGAAFFGALELAQHLLLGGVAGYVPVRARGEVLFAQETAAPFRPWVLAVLPALGGLASGLLTTKLAPEAAGGGGDVTIDAYHKHGALIRGRVIVVKALASVLTLGTGGAGGREGPTMLVGAATGSLVGRLLPTSARERRILMVAGIAAGMSAVFRTPLGAALLAVEMLYRDDFESDALVPSILASVVAYSIVIAVFGEANLFGRLPHLPFSPRQLPLYVVLGVIVAGASVEFARALRRVHAGAERLPVPAWARPALGGLAMGLFSLAALTLTTAWLGARGHTLGLVGGGYGFLQMVLTGAPDLPQRWTLVALLVALAAGKLVAASLTIGSGGSAGDFAPALVIGGLLGAAFGHAARLLVGDPAIDPAAFALVGMGTFYGGIAHVPLSALVLVCELAGSYDLLVPMMLAVGIAYVALRRVTLYEAQPQAKVAALAPGVVPGSERLEQITVDDVLVAPEVEPVAESLPIRAAAELVAASRRQLVLIVTGADGRPRGVVDIEDLREAARDPHLGWAVVGDVMVPWCSVSSGTSLAAAGRRLVEGGLRQVPVTSGGASLGYVGEVEIARAVLRARPVA